MATATFWAGTTSSTANASTLVVGNDAPVLLTFTNDDPNISGPDETGNLFLESTGGSPDPNTWVIIDGITYAFTFDVVGTFPIGDNKVPDTLEGKLVGVISVPGVGNFFFVLDGSATEAEMDDTGPGNIRLDSPNTDPPPTPVCFCAGTEILTPSGQRKVETLRAGDLVLNDRGEAKQLLWVGCSRLTQASLRAQPNLRPIRIPAGAIAPGRPEADLHVSPQHRVVIEGSAAELLFGEERVLVAAKHLVGRLAEVLPPEAEVAYYHLLLEDHEILDSNGLHSESFQPARRTIDAMSEENQALLVKVLEALGMEEMLARKDALPGLRRHEALVLADVVADVVAGVVAGGTPAAPAMPAAGPDARA